jgi:hypothetical protein
MQEWEKMESVTTHGQQVVKHAGVVVRLGERDFIIPPLSLGQLETHKELIAKTRAIDSTDIYALMREALPLIHAAISRNYPVVTLAELAELVDIVNYRTVINEIFGVSALQSRADKMLKEAQAAGELVPVGAEKAS